MIAKEKRFRNKNGREKPIRRSRSEGTPLFFSLLVAVCLGEDKAKNMEWKWSDMAHIIMVVTCLAVVFATGGVKKVEQEVSCLQYKGDGLLSKWVVCPNCGGTAEIKTEIFNGGIQK